MPLTPLISFMHGRWLRWWLTASFFMLFCGTFFFDSHTALLNVVDALFFLPGLTLLTRAVVSGDHRILTARVMWPLYAFLAWALLTMSWAAEPNLTRTMRAAVQIIVLVGMFRWLHLYFPHTLKQALTNGAICAALTAAVVMVSYYTTQPFFSPLFAQPAPLILDMPALPVSLAMMAIVTPLSLLLMQGVARGATGKGARRLAAAAMILFFSVLVAPILGIMLVALVITWSLWRRQQMTAAGGGLIVAVLLMIAGSQTLWPWPYVQAPLFGHGLNQATLGHVIAGSDEAISQLNHPQNMLWLILHKLGLIGLALFIAMWWLPFKALRSKMATLDGFYVLPIIPSAMVLFATGAMLLVPFHASWMALWLPLALLLAPLSDRGTIHPGKTQQGAL